MGKYPKLNSEYYDDITRQIRSGANKIAEMTKEKKALDKMIKSGNFAGQKLHELNEEFTKVQRNIIQERENQQKTVKAMCDEFVEELRKEDDLNPKDIVPGDLELLKSFNLLTDRDLMAMIDRNSTNRTMSQLILRQCREHGNRDLKLGIMYQGNDNIIQNVNILPDIAKTIFRYDDGMEGSAGYIYSEVLGEGSDLANMFSPDND